jgi:organic radical activating enzyme
VLTGGEPLVQPDATAYLAQNLRLKGYTVHLETNGTLPDGFAGVRPRVDFVCMDIKLPSTQDGASCESEHRRFLEMLENAKAAVKIVVTPSTTDSEFEGAVGLIEEVNPYLPFLVQPQFINSKPAVDTRRLLEFHAAATARVHDVRISIQLHKILGIR